MTRAWVFIFLYGAAGIIGTFLVIFWGMTAKHRIKLITHPWYHDRYAILCLAIVLFTLGTTFEMMARMYGNIQYGLSTILQHGEGEIIAIGVMLVLSGLGGMVWLADLERTSKVHFPWLIAMGIVTVLWGFGALLIAPMVPWTPVP